jgi:tripartite ATP-independent transporter DctM subunit
VFLFLLVIGGLYWGLFTPTEAGAVGAGGSIVLGLLRRRLTWRFLYQTLTETTRISCMILVIVAGASVFARFLAVTRLPFYLATWITHLPLPPYGIMIFIICIYFLGGCFIDPLALILLTIPIFFPVVTSMGFDPVWFGVVIVLISQIGAITPPVGINVYVVKGVAQDTSLGVIFKGVAPFLIPLCITALLLIPFPQLVLFLPNLMR